MVENELITDMWKRRMKEVLQMIYHNQLKEDGLNKLLDAEVERSLSQGVRKVSLRDIYRFRSISIDLNEVLLWINKHNLIIGANGSFSYSPEDVLGDTSIMIIEDLDGRAAEKKLAKNFEKENKLKEAKLHDDLQLKHKRDTNSTYGIACMEGSFLFSPDAATFITTQSRELISEMMWSFERFLVNNLQFQTYDEALLYINNCLNEERHYNEFKQYLDYIPSTKDIVKFLLSKFSDIPDFNKRTKDISRSLYYMIKGFTEEERVYIYYKFNFKNFLVRNSKIMNIFKLVLDGPVDFLDPNNVPDVYKGYCDELIRLTQEFCYAEFMTTHRVDKYFHCGRKTILLSDTDSVFIILGHIMEVIYEQLGWKYSSRNNDFKLVNTLCTLNTHFINMRHERFVTACNVKYKFPDYKLNAKNEFYYKRVVVYTGIKKNYSGLKLLREGNILPPKKQISHTGIKLTTSRIPDQVEKFQTRLLEEDILRADVINPAKIIRDIQIEAEEIKQIIRSGDKSMGIPQRFSGYNKYKNFNSVQICRLVEIWNRIYPDQRISNGEYMMCFETKIYNESYLHLIKDPEMRIKVREAVFADRYDGEPNFLKSHGLVTVAIPKDGAMTKIPDWILDIIDYDLMARKHLQTITDLLPSLDMNKIKTRDFSTYSSLMKI